MKVLKYLAYGVLPLIFLAGCGNSKDLEEQNRLLKQQLEQARDAEAEQRQEAEQARDAEAEQRQKAEIQRQKAEILREAEVKAREMTEQARNNAAVQREKAEKENYFNAIALAQVKINEGFYIQAEELLRATPQKYRNGEWDRLMSLCQKEKATPPDR